MSARGARRRTIARSTMLVAVLALLATTVPAHAGLIRNPVQVRIEGYIDATEQQTNAWMMLDVWLERAPGRRFALMNIIVLSAGDVSGPDIMAAIQPLHPNLILNGDAPLLEQISTAQPNQYLKITGYTAFGPQRILVTNVERSAPIVGPTPTKSMAEKVFGY
jgi:hypothetical protein